MAIDYKEVIEFTYDKYIVTPGTALDTIVKPAGNYAVKTIILEWTAPTSISNHIQMEFPANEGWVYSLPQPNKPREELDMFDITITGTKREAN